MHQFPDLFHKILYMFRTSPLSISTLYTRIRYLWCKFCWLSASVVRIQDTTRVYSIETQYTRVVRMTTLAESQQN